MSVKLYILFFNWALIRVWALIRTRALIRTFTVGLLFINTWHLFITCVSALRRVRNIPKPGRKFDPGVFRGRQN